MRDIVDNPETEMLVKDLKRRLDRQGEASRENVSELREIIEGLTKRISVLEARDARSPSGTTGFSRRIYNPLTVFLCGAIFGVLLALV